MEEKMHLKIYLTLNEKSRIDNSRTVCKKCQIYLYGLKKDLFGCFRIEEIRDNNNETDLKEEGGIEMSTTVLPLRDARSLRFDLPVLADFKKY